MKVIALGFVCIFFGIILCGDHVAGVTKDVLWTTAGSVDVAKNIVSPTVPVHECPTYVQDTFIPFLNQNKSMCMYGNLHTRFGTFFDGSNRRAVIARPFDTELHQLWGVCDGFRCQYSAETDVLVTQTMISQYMPGVIVYKNASKKISVSKDVQGNSKFTFNGGVPDYSLRVPDGPYIPASSFALSNNGEWLAVELRDEGVALIKIQDLSVRHITSISPTYGVGFDPSVELAVSNDGKSILLTGQNSGFMMIDVVPGCGQSIVTGLVFAESTVRCPYSDMQIGNIVQSFFAGYRPLFNDNGTQLEAIVSSWTGMRLVTLSIAGPRPDPVYDYIALGDSFVSGEGESDRSYYIDQTNSCHVSRRAYPFLVSSLASFLGSKVGSVACAGARIGDIIGAPSTYKGQGGRFAATNDLTVKQAHARTALTSGVILQSDFVEMYTPKVVTVGVGGNDAGLMGKLRACAMPGTCEWATGNGLRKSANEIQRMFDKLVFLYTDLVRKSSTTRFYAIGYPNIMHAAGLCDSVTQVLFDTTERQFMRESLQYLNLVVKAAAEKAGIGYIDIQNSFEGNELCSGGSVPAMNGLRLGKDVPLLSAFPSIKVFASESFHPTPAGHTLIAGVIHKAHPDLREGRYCEGDQLVCPKQVSVPGLPHYFTAGSNTTASGASYYEYFAYADKTIARIFNIFIDSGVFSMHSTVKVELHSDIAELGSFVVDENGQVDVSVLIPDSIGDGVHALHVLGEKDDGSLIDMYQFIEINNESISVIDAGTGTLQSDLKEMSKGVLAQNTPTQLYSNPDSMVLGQMTQQPKSEQPNMQQQVTTTGAEEKASTQNYVRVIAGLSVLGLIVIFVAVFRWVKQTG